MFSIGSYFSSQSVIILYLLRFGMRVENFMTFVLDYAVIVESSVRHVHVPQAICTLGWTDPRYLRVERHCCIKGCRGSVISAS